MFLHPQEDLRRIGERLAGGLALIYAGPFAESLCSYSPVGEETHA